MYPCATTVLLSLYYPSPRNNVAHTEPNPRWILIKKMQMPWTRNWKWRHRIDYVPSLLQNGDGYTQVHIDTSSFVQLTQCGCNNSPVGRDVISIRHSALATEATKYNVMCLNIGPRTGQMHWLTYLVDAHNTRRQTMSQTELWNVWNVPKPQTWKLVK